MTAELRRSLVLAGAGLLGGFALVVALFGTGELVTRGFGPAPAKQAAPLLPAVPRAPEPGAGATRAGDGAAVPGAGAALRGEGAALRGEGAPAAPGKSAPAAAPEPGDGPAPTFDIIRVEPTGEAVIAGRAAPNTTVEMLRDGQPFARALVDPSGQFALVPPALPTGSSEITLRVTGADGQARPSRESVVVVVAAGRGAKPLIALTAPGKPTVVLSQPDPVAAAAPAAGNPADAPASAKGAAKLAAKVATEAPPARRPGQPPAARRQAAAPEAEGPATDPVKIVSVDAEEGGRLYVTSWAPPGATVRLYLNDAPIAPGSAGPDGRVAFTIGRGVVPGDYRIRVDQVDPVTGTVKTRSEVSFVVPAALARPGAPAKPVAAAPPSVTAPAVPPGVPLAVLAPPPAEPARSPPRRQAVSMAPASFPPPAESPPRDPPVLGATAGGAIEAGGAARMAERPARSEGTRAVFVPEISTARITRGDSLWQISRRAYGRGMRYTVIFDANQPQIRNPALIYPGQVFVLPADGTAAVPEAEKRG